MRGEGAHWARPMPPTARPNLGATLHALQKFHGRARRAAAGWDSRPYLCPAAGWDSRAYLCPAGGWDSRAYLCPAAGWDSRAYLP